MYFAKPTTKRIASSGGRRLRDLIGVNNRNLRLSKWIRSTTLRMAGLISKNVVGVAESGIEKGADVARLRAAGYQAFLIGGNLMKSESPGETLRGLIARRNHLNSA